MPLDVSNVIAVILAGGYGTRIQHLLPGVPKPMASVAGKPFLEWVVRYLAVQGITKAVLSTGYLAQVVEEHFQTQPVQEVQTICCQEASPLGTAGGFLNVVRQMPETPDAWLVLNGDSLIFPHLASLTADLVDSTFNGVVVGLAVTDAGRYGSMVCNDTGKLVRFEEKRPGAGVISTGVYLLRHSLLKEFPQGSPLSFEHQVFPTLLKKDINLKVNIVNTPFLDIGTPESFPQTETFILHNLHRFTSLC